MTVGMFTGIKSIIAGLFSLIFSLVSILTPVEVVPEYTDLEIPEKAIYDEGEFIMGDYDIVVSVSGNDSNDGSLVSPVKTVEKAKALAAEKSALTDDTVTVWFQAGTYPIEKAIAIGEETENVVFRSMPNETVVFSGAKEYSDWTETTVNGIKAFVTDVPAGEVFNACYKDGVRLERPSTEIFEVKDAKDEDCFDPSQSYFKIHVAFYADKADLKEYYNLRDVDVRILHYWNDELLPVATIDYESGKVCTAKPASMTIAKEDRYYFENVFEEFTKAQQWYLDQTANKLYYIPAEGETVDNTVLMGASNCTLFDIANANGIAFEGITFANTGWDIINGTHFTSADLSLTNPIAKYIEYTANFPQAAFDIPAAIPVKNSTNINFTNCTFTDIGNTAVLFGSKTKNCKVETCLFDNIGANGVFIKGDNVQDESAQTAYITVRDCHIRSYGRVYNNAIGVLLTHANHCDISHNEIHDGLYTAISVGWVWGYAFSASDYNTICDNLIYDIGQGWLSDMGGIYTLGIQPHTVLSGNVIHDVGCYQGSSGYGGWGVYLDEGSSGILVTKNLCYNCSSQGFHQHYGEDNMITNNIFALNGEGQVRLSRTEDHNSFFFENNILLADDTVMYYNIPTGAFTDNNNFYWDLENGSTVYSGSSTKIVERKGKLAVEGKGYYNNGHFENPLFRDPLNDDFTIADNSPVFDSGFESWNYYEAGTLTLFD